MRKGLMLVLALLMVSCLMAAAAYSNALVKNDAELTTVSTDNANLRMWVENNDGDVPAEVGSDGRLYINFSKGFDDGKGLQPGSTYTFNRLFFVANESNNEYDMRVRLVDRNGDVYTSDDFKISVWTDENLGVDDPVSAAKKVFVNQNNNDTTAWWTMCVDDNKPIGVRIAVADNADMDEFKDLQLQVVSVNTNSNLR